MLIARLLSSVSVAATIAACGGRTPLLLDTSPSDGGASLAKDTGPSARDASSGSDAEPVDATTDSTVIETPDATSELPDVTTDALDQDVTLPAEGAAATRVVFFGTGGPYDEDSLQAFLAAYPATVTRMATNASPVSAATLAPFDVVILDNVARSFDSSEAAALAAWVEGGGSVMSLGGFVNAPGAWQQPDTLLADLPLQFNSTFYLGDSESGCPGDVTDFAAFPVTSGLQAVPFCGGFGVTVAGACDPVAFVQGGPVGAICEQAAGRVYLWGDDWVEYSPTWIPGMDTRQFWQDAMDWLTHKI